MKTIRFGICLLIVFAVAAHGAVEVWSESIVEIGASVLLAAWVLSAFFSSKLEVTWHPLNWPILGICAIGLTQLIALGTAYPFATKVELLRAVACWMVFFLATQAFRTRGELYGFAWFLMLLCFVVSVLAIAQYFTSGDKIYWFRDVASGVKPFGPFVNRNHFAGFVELTLPVGLGLLMLRGLRREIVPLAVVLTVVPISAVVLSSSRGGIIGIGIEICILIALRISRRGVEKIQIGALAVALIVAIGLIGWVGASNAISRFTEGGASGVPASKRASMLRGALHIFRDHPVFGSGLGTTEMVYPKYETLYDGKVVDHVHDDYAEALAETGIAGGICGAGFLWLLFARARANFLAGQGQFSRAFHAAGIAAVSGLLFHSFVDFNLHILSNAILFLVLACVATCPPVSPESLRQKSSSRFAVS